MTRRQRSSRPGPRRLPDDVVAFEQRERLMAAMATAVAERGYERTTITDIVTTAAIARPTFYQHFDDKEACFLATFDALTEHARKLMSEAYDSREEWPEKVAASLIAMVRFLTEHPEAAKVCLVEVGAVGPAIHDRVERLIEWLIAMLAGRPGGEAEADDPARGQHEAVVIGTMMMLSWRFESGTGGDARSLTGEVIESFLGPYVGFEQAREIAEQHWASVN